MSDNRTKGFRQTFFATAASVMALSPSAFADPPTEPSVPPSWITTSGGCKVWNPRPQQNETVEWTGACIDGYADGDGVLKWYRDGVINEDSSAHMVRGHANGKMKTTYKNGDSFEGTSRDDQHDGPGVYHFHGGGDYTGEFSSNKFNGYGTRHGPAGFSYVGQWKNGRPDGRGVASYADGARYDGFWTDGKYEGFGEKTYAEGGSYRGEWHLGKTSGRGNRIYVNGDTYSGQWLDGQRNGQGTRTFAGGDYRSYTGTWKNDLADGAGTLTFANGDRYTGEMSQGKVEGQGTFVYADGTKYVGHFMHGERDGYGVFIWADGRRYEGQWIAGRTGGNGKFFDKGGKVIRVNREDAINLIADAGVYKIPVTINDRVTLNFIIDSGASDVSIPMDVVLVMFRSGTLTERDFIGSQTYVQADGSSVPSATFRIASLRVGDHVIKDVIGSVSNVRGELLLGQSFLSRLQKWSLNNTEHVLEIEQRGNGQ